MSAKKPNAQLKLKMLRLLLRMPVLKRKPSWLTIREDITWPGRSKQGAKRWAGILVTATIICVAVNAQPGSCSNTYVGGQS